MSEKREHPNDPLHGVKLETMLTDLVEYYGWDDMACRIRINCFAKDPSVKSSLKFLRRTPWAKNKVEILYRHYLEVR
ncbi:VF530 family DNA-binding protein [Rubritalea sp.]|uniref:VF530 family protein n=1 Tax=Rubritalea sp. TaxID=2109375 RepID=UPI003EF0D875